MHVPDSGVFHRNDNGLLVQIRQMYDFTDLNHRAIYRPAAAEAAVFFCKNCSVINNKQQQQLI